MTLIQIDRSLTGIRLGTRALLSLLLKRQNIQLPAREVLQKQLLERMIVNRAQMQLARETGIRIDDLLLDRAIARIAEQNKLTVQAFRDQLEGDGLSFARFREEVREEITLQRLREREVDNKIQITDAEIDNFLAAAAGNADEAQSEINMAQILVRIPENATPEQIAERRKRADQALAQLNSGVEFAKVAASFSDAGDALTGGELGWRSASRLPQLFLDATEKIKEGEVAPLVRSANGFHILKVIGRRSAGMAKTGPGAVVQQTLARHILIKVNQIVSAVEARRKLVELKERLDNKAAKFEELARLYSNDGSASKGGDLGWIYPGDTVPEFERAMNALQPGEVSGPIESPFGYHLIEVIERKSEEISRERQRLMARQALREQKLEESYEDWLRQLRDRAYVEYRLDDINRP
ncbi:MAG: peptidylprolyl isomerase [Oxalobacteraceae bacterium]|nr:peptidylprolyl isomerase [Oxalobacteraceae bacterium]